MPTYVYVCNDHKPPFKLQLWRSVFESEALPECMKCKKPMTRVYDAPPVTFKGNGWAKNEK